MAKPTSVTSASASLWLPITVLIIWGVAPVLIAVVILFIPDWYPVLKWIGGTLAVLWATTSLLIFCAVLRGGFGGRRSSRLLHGMLGLMCTFVLGLPAFVVSSLPIVGSPMDFVEAFNPKGNEVRLDEDSAVAPQGPNLYIVGIDFSSSFIAGSEDPRLASVYNALDSIFWSTNGEGLSYSLDSKDLALFFGFADQGLFLASNERDGQGWEGLRRQAFQNLKAVVPDYLGGRVPPEGEDVRLNRSVTDLVDFLNARVCAEIRDRGDNYSQIRIIIFSDLLQSVPLPGAGGDLESIKRVRAERLDQIEACLKKPNLVVTAFSLPSQKGSPEVVGDHEMNVGSYFKSNLSERWQTIDLDEYSKAEQDKRVMLCEGLYTKVVSVTRPLYLKYRPGPEWENISSSLRLPKSVEADRIFLGLSSVPGTSYPIKVRLVKERVSDFVLGLEANDLSYKSLSRASSEQYPLQISMEGYPDIARSARAQLLVGVPRQSILYKVPIVALAILPSGALIIIKVILLILHLFPVALAVMVILDLLGTRARSSRRRPTSTTGLS